MKKIQLFVKDPSVGPANVDFEEAKEVSKLADFDLSKFESLPKVGEYITVNDSKKKERILKVVSILHGIIETGNESIHGIDVYSTLIPTEEFYRKYN